MPIRDFEKQGALQIIVYLYDHKDHKINVSELDRNIKAHRSTILTPLEMLHMNRVIDEEINLKFPFDHSVWLTSLGVEVGSQLKAVANSLLDRAHPKRIQDAEHRESPR